LDSFGWLGRIGEFRPDMWYLRAMEWGI
jgi:hypothetical protein